jgi:hypothetical protein
MCVAALYLSACAQITVPTERQPIKACIEYRSKQTGGKQWERVLIVGEYSETEWLVILPDRIGQLAERPVPMSRGSITQRCPMSLWGLAAPADSAQPPVFEKPSGWERP